MSYPWYWRPNIVPQKRRQIKRRNKSSPQEVHKIPIRCQPSNQNLWLHGKLTKLILKDNEKPPRQNETRETTNWKILYSKKPSQIMVTWHRVTETSQRLLPGYNRCNKHKMHPTLDEHLSSNCTSSSSHWRWTTHWNNCGQNLKHVRVNATETMQQYIYANPTFLDITLCLSNTNL